MYTEYRSLETRQQAASTHRCWARGEGPWCWWKDRREDVECWHQVRCSRPKSREDCRKSGNLSEDGSKNEG